MNLQCPRALRDAVAAICPDIESRVVARGGAVADERQLWWELSCCLLSSQVPFDLAAAAASRIDVAGTLRHAHPRDVGSVRSELLGLLTEPLPFGNGWRRYRFPVARAGQLAQAWSAVMESGWSLGQVVAGDGDAEAVRGWLVRNVPGLGPKQASMFLRNVGASYDLAVLDRHVLGYMAAVGIGQGAPKSIGTLRAYQRREAHLRDHARGFGYPVGLVDWAIWIVMRVAGGMTVEEGCA